jgi:hypothetical protein
MSTTAPNPRIFTALSPLFFGELISACGVCAAAFYAYLIGQVTLDRQQRESFDNAGQVEFAECLRRDRPEPGAAHDENKQPV